MSIEPLALPALSRRRFLAATLAAGGASVLQADPAPRKAQIAITLDLEMSRNFPAWETTHWDYEKGNLDDATKQYALAAGRKVRAAGGVIHYFCVGRVLEQPDVSWLQQLAEAGHPIGNHTYDHVNLRATKPEEIQYRFQRAPWLIAGKTVAEVLEENVRLTTLALQQRVQIKNRGFRTPGGFPAGLDGREDLQKMLLAAGFTWVSSQYPKHAEAKPLIEPTAEFYDGLVAAQAQAQPFIYPTGLIEVPMSPISDIGAFRTGRWKLAWFLTALDRILDHVLEQRAAFDFLAHPSCLGVVDPEMQALDLICRKVQAAGDRAELVDLDALARRAAA